MDRHLGLLGPGAAVVYDGDDIKPGAAPEGVQLCPLPVRMSAQQPQQAGAEHPRGGRDARMMGIGFSRWRRCWRSSSRRRARRS